MVYFFNTQELDNKDSSSKTNVATEVSEVSDAMKNKKLEMNNVDNNTSSGKRSSDLATDELLVIHNKKPKLDASTSTKKKSKKKYNFKQK